MGDFDVPKHIQVEWPVGPLYIRLPDAGAGEVQPWVNYKLVATRWHIEALNSVVSQVGFQRCVGVEMALAGTLASLNGAFDAAVAGLIFAGEEFLRTPKRTKPFNYR